jgi:hypothetical protein
MMVDRRDFYAVLEVDPGAPQEAIRSAYKRLALLYHPDHSDQPDATRRMQRLNEAYAVIGVPERRVQYDLERVAPVAPEAPVPPAPTPPAPAPPAPTPVQTEKKASPPRRRRKRDDRLARLLVRLTGWIQSPLKVLFYLFAAMLVLFLWSFVTGEVSYIALGAIVLTAIWVILSVIIKLRNFTASSK